MESAFLSNSRYIRKKGIPLPGQFFFSIYHYSLAILIIMHLLSFCKYFPAFLSPTVVYKGLSEFVGNAFYAFRQKYVSYLPKPDVQKAGTSRWMPLLFVIFSSTFR